MALILGASTIACGSANVSAQGRPALLIVGDSLIAAAMADLKGFTPSGTSTTVLAGVGASPCDLWTGYRAARAFGGGYLSFKATLESERPKAVVLAFTGNPGVSDHACIQKPTTAYSLSTIVATYRRSLTAMGTLAAQTGAHVYLSATPARNPAIPEGWQDQTQHGYNGDPAFNAMMSKLASSKGWTYDTTAAAAISGPGLGWALYLPCQPGTGQSCVDGREQVRYGGSDAIHCDAPGTNGVGAASDGSLRFAHGLLVEPLAGLGLQPLGQVRSSPTTLPQRLCV
jgi:hypothetical protein